MKRIETACIIDDDDIAIWGITRMMKHIDFTDNIIVFKNGLEAINGIKKSVEFGEKLPEMILLDLNMPFMDGWGFLDELTKIDPPEKILIFIITSSVDPEDYKRAKKYQEVTDYIVKPIKAEDLQKILSLI